MSPTPILLWGPHRPPAAHRPLQDVEVDGATSPVEEAGAQPAVGWTAGRGGGVWGQLKRGNKGWHGVLGGTPPAGQRKWVGGCAVSPSDEVGKAAGQRVLEDKLREHRVALDRTLPRATLWPPPQPLETVGPSPLLSDSPGRQHHTTYSSPFACVRAHTLQLRRDHRWQLSLPHTLQQRAACGGQRPERTTTVPAGMAAWELVATALVVAATAPFVAPGAAAQVDAR